MPLSQKEIEQRRAAAKARWAKEGPTATFMVGKPGSGKTTWRHVNRKDAVHISTDDIRDEMGLPFSFDNSDKAEGLARSRFRAALSEGKDVVLDRTNLTAKSRARWLDLLPDHYRREAVVVDTHGLERAYQLSRRPKSEGIALLRRHKVELQIPGDEFDRIEVVRRGPSKEAIAWIKARKGEARKADMGIDLLKRALTKFQESQVKRDDRGRFADKGGAGGAPSFRQASWASIDNGPKRSKGLTSSLYGRSKRNEDDVRSFSRRLIATESEARDLDAALKPDDVEGRLKVSFLRDRAERLRTQLQAATPHEESSRRFKHQVPKSLGQEGHNANLRRVQSTVNAMRDATIERATERGLIPEGTPISDVKRAYRHVNAIALHRAGLIDYDFKMTPEDRATFTPLVGFMRYADRRMKSEITGQHKGISDPYKAEFGAPFIDKKTGQQKVNRMTGEARVRFRPHHEYVKADGLMKVSDPDWLGMMSDAEELVTAVEMAEGVLAKGTYSAVLRSGARKFFGSITPSSEARVQRMALAARGDRGKYFASTESWGRGVRNGKPPGTWEGRQKGESGRKNLGASGIYRAEIGRRVGGKPPAQRSIYRADETPRSLIGKADGLAKREPTHIRDLL